MNNEQLLINHYYLLLTAGCAETHHDALSRLPLPHQRVLDAIPTGLHVRYTGYAVVLLRSTPRVRHITHPPIRQKHMYVLHAYSPKAHVCTSRLQV